MSEQLIEYQTANVKLASNDIVLWNYFKVGTHFMKTIVLELLWNDPLNESPEFIDLGLNISNSEGVSGMIGENKWNQWIEQTNDGYPRILSTHLPPDAYATALLLLLSI